MRREHLSALRLVVAFALQDAERQRERMVLPRKRRVRAPRGWSKIDDLHDYMQSPSLRACADRGDASIVVSDDWPEQIPITDAELRVIEGHLRGELDKLFGPLP